MKFTPWGKQIQAVAQNRLGASLAGIDPRKVSSTVFSLSGGLAAFAGALLAPVINASPDVGIFPAIKSYVVVVLGGMGSLWELYWQACFWVSRKVLRLYIYHITTETLSALLF